MCTILRTGTHSCSNTKALTFVWIQNSVCHFEIHPDETCEPVLLYTGKQYAYMRRLCGFIFVDNLTVDTDNHSNVCVCNFTKINGWISIIQLLSHYTSSCSIIICWFKICFPLLLGWILLQQEHYYSTIICNNSWHKLRRIDKVLWLLSIMMWKAHKCWNK